MKTYPSKTSNFMAFAISAILSPYIAASVFIVIITYQFSQNLHQFLPWMGTFFLFTIFIPGTYTLWLLESKKIRDLHISVHKDRKIPFILAGVSAILGSILLYFLKASHQVVVMAVVYAVNAFAIGLITLFWKISVHTALFSAIATVILIIFGIQFWWLFLFLIPLAWARIYRKKHTVWQTVAGSLLAFVLTTATFWFFGYL